MIKKVLLTIASTVAVLFASDYEKEQSKLVSVKMQTRVGEAAINNILMSYFGGKHDILVKDKGSIGLDIKDIGIDIQENSEIVFGYDMTIAYDFEPDKPNIRLNGNFPIKGAISTKVVKQAAEDVAEKTENAIAVLLDLNRAIEEMLVKHGIDETPIISAIKKFFEKKEKQVDGKIALWRQNCSTLVNAYVDKTENVLDLKILDVKLNLTLNDDSVIIDFEAKVQSEKQFFRLEGWVENPDKLHIVSNKEFQITKINYRLWPNRSMVIGSVLRSCKNIPLEIKKDFDLYEICEEEPTSIKYSIEQRDFSMDITVKTKHGGIITIEKMLDRKLEQ